MAYQKTAKNLAWDKERQKLKSEVAHWQHEHAKAQSIISAQEQEMLAMHCEIEELKEAIAYLTNGTATPEEVLKKLDKNAELTDMLQFMVKSIPGGYLNG